MRPPPLPGLLHTMAPALDHYGYLAVAGLIFLEDFGVPVPGETVLIAAAVYAGAGRLNVAGVVVVAIAAAVLGDNVGYGLGRWGGRGLVERYGRYVRLTPQRYDHVESFFHRHGGKIVVIARFIEGLRQLNGYIAGATEMRWRDFLGFNALGAAVWVGVWVAVGDAAGSHIDAVVSGITRYSDYVFAGLVLVLLAAILRVALRRRARGRLRGAGQVAGTDAGAAARDLGGAVVNVPVASSPSSRERGHRPVGSSSGELSPSPGELSPSPGELSPSPGERGPSPSSGERGHRPVASSPAVPSPSPAVPSPSPAVPSPEERGSG